LAGKQSLALVFTNLLGNAADAMEGRGKIRIEGWAHDDAVEVAVVDDGPGIAPELHERIFEFDYSGRNPGRAGKLGFGLWWVKTVMVRLGGSVSVASDGRNGSTFRLWLPRVTETI
jgi:signal transduction histidine kinase